MSVGPSRPAEVAAAERIAAQHAGGHYEHTRAVEGEAPGEWHVSCPVCHAPSLTIARRDDEQAPQLLCRPATGTGCTPDRIAETLRGLAEHGPAPKGAAQSAPGADSTSEGTPRADDLAARNGDETAAAGFSIKTLTARELCALPDPPNTDQLLGELVVRGSRLVIGGQTGEGKTTLALSIVGAIALGRDFLGWKGRGGRALVLDAEQGLKTVKRRLTELELDQADDIDYARLPDGLSLDRDQEHITAVERLLAGGGYSVVQADPLYKLHAGDSNDERQAVDLMRRFDGWRERYGFALILPVHCRKTPPGAKFSQQEFFGSTGYLRGAEVVLGLKLVHTGYSHLHFFKDRDGDLPIGERWGLLFDREQGFRRDPEGEKPKSSTERVRELLEAKPGMSKAQLAAEADCAEKTVERALKEIGADGRRPGPQAEKLWSLTEEGEADA